MAPVGTYWFPAFFAKKRGIFVLEQYFVLFTGCVHQLCCCVAVFINLLNFNTIINNLWRVLVLFVLR